MLAPVVSSADFCVMAGRERLERSSAGVRQASTRPRLSTAVAARARPPPRGTGQLGGGGSAAQVSGPGPSAASSYGREAEPPTRRPGESAGAERQPTARRSIQEDTSAGQQPYTPGREDTLQLDTSGRYAEAIAGAVANVLRERLPPVSVPSPSARNTFEVTSALKRAKFSPPTLFQDVRSRRGRKKQASKLVSYVRDIILLPMEFRSRDGEISIPRSSRRNKLGKAGLVGKIEIDSTMTDSDVRREVCEVFAVPMGLSESDIGKNHPFPFTYLQRAGAGSRSLCLPSVKASFQWNGRQVASLAKSGSFIYLLAEAELPGYQSAIKKEREEMEHILLSSDEEADPLAADSGEEFPDASSVFSTGGEVGEEVIVVETPPNSQPSTSYSTPPHHVVETPPNSPAPTTTPEQPYVASPQPPPQPPRLYSTSPLFGSIGQVGSVSFPRDSGSSSVMEEPSYEPPFAPLDDLLRTFVDGIRLTARQVTRIYKFSGSDYEASRKCLAAGGPTLASVLNMVNKMFEHYPKTKCYIDSEDAWGDLLAQYKSSTMNINSQLRVTLNNQPPIDTGGVRRQVYTHAFMDFAANRHIQLFDGPANYLRPRCTAEVRSSGLLKVLGTIIAHSICQDGIGFSYLSPTCFWYIVGGEEKALQFACVEDLPGDSASVLKQMSDAKDDDDLNALFCDEFCCEVFQRCGITQTLKMTNRDVIYQEVLTFDAIGKISNLLDQLSSGLHALGVLPVVRAFPELFVPLFTYTAAISPEEVVDTLYLSDDEEEDEVALLLLKRWIANASEEMLRKFLFHITGTTIPFYHSIKVQYISGDPYGAIAAHTCEKVIKFPRGVFNSEGAYDLLAESLQAIITADLDFNTV